MVLGALIGGPIIDYIRRDIGKTEFEYLHTNAETGKMEKRYVEISQWRTIAFFGFILNMMMAFLLMTYRRHMEDQFSEITEEQLEQAQRLSCMAIISEIVND